nr:hypothetical protein [Tanacetum cinerariifolium]
MDTTIDQQVAMDEALVPHARRLRIGRSNFCLLSDTSSEESTLQVVYDVMRLTPFFKAFLVTADVLEIYMQEFWVTATVHHHSIRFKMDNKKHMTKASVEKTRSSFDTTVTPPPTAAAGLRLSTYEKGKQLAKASKAKSLTSFSEVAMTEAQQFKLATKRSLQQTHISQASGSSTDEGTGIIPGVLDVPTEEEEGQDEEDEEDELYRDININLGRGIQMADSSSVSSQFVTSMLNLKPDAGIESIFETTSQMDVQTPTSVAPLPVSAPTLTPSTIATITITQQAPTPSTTAPSTLLQDLPNFGSLFGFDHRLKTLEANFSEFMQRISLLEPSLLFPRSYMDQRMNETVKVAVQIQFDRLYNEAQAENDEFLKTIDENMQKIIKEQVKEQVKVQVSKILPNIEQTVNKQLEAEVLSWSSNSLKTSYAVATDLSEMELKKILLEKIEGNKSIHRSNEQRNLYKALVEAYESDKIILDTYGDTVMLKRRRDDNADKDEEPSAGSDRGSKRRREGKEPESASAPKEKATRSAGKSTQGSKSRQTSANESAIAAEPMQTTHEM